MNIVDIFGTVIFTSAFETLKDAVVDAVKTRANLYGANLCGAKLDGANLYGAKLTWAKLDGANLYGANLCGAKLDGANLYGANLYGANLCGAKLDGANLYGAKLTWANLTWAKLDGANLCGAKLDGANLYGANLTWAKLDGANLYGAKLDGANLCGANLDGIKNASLTIARLQFIPVEGEFVGWKKCEKNVIVKLLIPASAKRSHGTERKCRASQVQVLEVFGAKSGISIHDGVTQYYQGKIVTPDGFDENRWNTCGQGIHFYLTREEAEAHC